MTYQDLAPIKQNIDNIKSKHTQTHTYIYSYSYVYRVIILVPINNPISIGN